MVELLIRCGSVRMRRCDIYRYVSGAVELMAIVVAIVIMISNGHGGHHVILQSTLQELAVVAGRLMEVVVRLRLLLLVELVLAHGRVMSRVLVVDRVMRCRVNRVVQGRTCRAGSRDHR